MLRFIILRLLQTIAALYILLTAVFFLVRLTGDPTYFYISSQSTQEDVERTRARLGLDKPVLVQYAIYMKNLLKGDLGESMQQDRPVKEMIAERIPNTLKLGIPSFIIGMIIAFLLGVTTAIKRDTFYDNSIKVLITAGISAPPFFIAIMLVLIFSSWLNWLPPAAYGDINITHYIMPVTVTAIFIAPIMQKIIRSSMLDVLDSEYIKLARIKGLPERVVIWKHTLRNAMIAPLTSMGYFFSMVIAGSIITENIFLWPGLGQLSVESLVGRDYQVVQACVLLFSSILLIMNLVVDILYAAVDPKIRYQTM